jgi:hypothetical protein
MLPVTRPGMRARLARTASTLAAAGALLGAAGGSPPPPDVATWVYGAHRWSARETAAELGRLPGGATRLYVTYEYRDPAVLGTALRATAEALAPRPGFRGLAVFGHGQPFDAPRGAAVEGRVVDGDGRAVAGARVRAGAESTTSNRCGLFALRRLPSPVVWLTVEADGFRPADRRVTGLAAGRQRDLAPLVLERP